MAGNYTGIGIKNAIGFIRNPIASYNNMLSDLRKHIIGYYNVAKQGCTNDSLAENPVLKNLSKRKVYGYDFNNITLAAGVTKASDYKALIPAQSLSSSRNIIAKDVNVGDSFPAYSVRISGLQEGNIIELPTGSGLARKDGVYNIVKHTYTEDEDLWYRYVLRSGDYNDLTIEILPLTLDLHLHNFEFGGLSGIGSYMYNLGNINKWNNTSHAEEFQVTDNVFKFINIKENYNLCFILFRLWYLKEGALIRVQITGIPDGGVVELGSNGRIVRANKDGIYEGIAISDNNDNTTVSSINCIGSTITVKWLPSFPNSLVFNGVAPTWVYRNGLLNTSGFSKWIDHNKIKVIKSPNNTGSIICSANNKGTVGQTVNFSIPSFKLKIDGMPTGIRAWLNYGYTTNSGSTYKFIALSNTIYNGITIIPSLQLELVPDTEEDYIGLVHCRIGFFSSSFPIQGIENTTIEFLPNYAAPTTKMYGDIPSLAKGAKCMLMDVIPISCGEIGVMYSQDNNTPLSSYNNYNYAIMYYNHNGLAYKERNRNGTYINGVYNRNIPAKDLILKRQVIGVNTSEIKDTEITVGSVITGGYPYNMALNSLILFDRELTGEEMKLVMKKLMGFEEEDNLLSTFSNGVVNSNFEGTTDISEEYSEEIN